MKHSTAIGRKRARLTLMKLEQRILFDGAAVAEAIAADTPGTEQTGEKTQILPPLPQLSQEREKDTKSQVKTDTKQDNSEATEQSETTDSSQQNSLEIDGEEIGTETSSPAENRHDELLDSGAPKDQTFADQLLDSATATEETGADLDNPAFSDGVTLAEEEFTDSDEGLPLTSDSERTELFVIDDSVTDKFTLLESIGSDKEIIEIDPLIDGVHFLTETLSAYENLDTLHIYSHGADGTINLGSSILSSVSLEGTHGSDVEKWASSFNEDGDILLYGCDVASTDIGETFVRKLGDLTNTDVAASSDATGSEQDGGDWDLEYQTGTVESEVVDVSDFSGLLPGQG